MRHELHLTSVGLRTLVPFAALMVAVGGVVGGGPGAASAATGVGVVMLNHLVAAISTGWSAELRPGVLGVSYAVFALRMVAVFVAFAVLSSMPWVHRPLLAIAFCVSLVVVLAAECLSFARQSYVPSWRTR